MTSKKLVCLGELLIDMVSPALDADLGEARDFLKAPGGAPANVAVGAQKLGVPSEFIGSVGCDPFGDFLAQTLENENVGLSGLQKIEGARTTIAFVATRGDGKKEICFYRNPGADALLDGAQIPNEILENAAILHVGSVSLSLEPCRSAQFAAIESAKKSGALISFDPNWRPSIWGDDFALAHDLIWQTIPLSDIVKVADEEWEFVTGERDFEAGAAKILARGPRLLVMTRGGENVAFAARDFAGEVESFSVKALDTLGAGDAFVAGLLTQIIESGDLEAFLTPEKVRGAVRFACACGALATLKNGAIPALPTRAQVDEFLQNQAA